MINQPNPTVPNQDQAFAEQARMRRSGVLTDFWQFLRYNKKWWLAPIVIVLLLVGLLIVLSGTAAAPLIYTLF